MNGPVFIGPFLLAGLQRELVGLFAYLAGLSFLATV